MTRGLLIALVLAAGAALAAAIAYQFRASLLGQVDAMIPWVICAQEGDQDRAIRACTIVIDCGARENLIDRVWAYYNRGVAYDAKGEADRALADYSEAIKLDPKNGAAYGNRGTIYHQRGDWQRAGADYDQAIRLDANDAFAYRNRGTLRMRLHDDAGALADLEAAIRLKPRFASAYGDRGRLYETRGDLDHALADFARLRELRPADADAKAAEDRVTAKLKRGKT